MCTTKVGASTSDHTGKVTLGAVGTIGAVTTAMSSSRSGSTVSSTGTTHTATTSLLGGLIKIDAISTIARESLGAGRYSGTGSTTLLGLRIAGKSYAAKPAANTTVSIPGIVSIELNRQTRANNSSDHAIRVTALEVTVNPKNDLGLPTGVVIVGSSLATLQAPVYHRAYGSAYGTDVSVASLAGSGPTAPVYVPCGGTGNKTLSNKTAGVNVAGAVTVAAVASSGTSHDTASKTVVNTSSRLAGVSLLGGVIKVSALTTSAHATRTGSHLVLSSSGTTLVGLTINGKSMSFSHPVSYTIPQIGTLSIGRATKTKTGIHVTGLRLVLGFAQGNLKKGTVITVGSALAGSL